MNHNGNALCVHIGIAIACAVSGCASRDEALRTEFARRKAMEYANSGEIPAASLAAPQKSGEAEEKRPAPSQDRRIVVYEATYGLVVKDVESAGHAIEALTTKLGGYVDRLTTDSIKVRIPANRFDEALAEVEKLGEIAHKLRQSIDITDEYVDLEARIKNAAAVRARLEALLAKAENVTAALEVEKELARVTGEIESLQVKLELLKNRVSYSTISIQLLRVHRAGPPPQNQKLPFAWLQELDPNRLTGNWSYR